MTLSIIPLMPDQALIRKMKSTLQDSKKCKATCSFKGERTPQSGREIAVMSEVLCM